MKPNTIIATAAALLLALIAFLVWQHISRLDRQLANLGATVEELRAQTQVAESRATVAEERAEKAEQQATAAAASAEQAGAREQQSAEQARQEQTARQAAEEQARREAAARSEAQFLAEVSEKARQAAEEERVAAEQQRLEAIEKAEAAAIEVERARAEAEEIRQRMNAELDRLQGALGRIANTKRTALGLVMTLDSRQVEFDFNKTELRPENRELLSRIAGVLLTFNSYGVQIFGHTDNVGSPEYNQILSEKRAEAVRRYLIEAGIEAEVLSTMGLGKSSPLVEGDDPESRQRNRRVELAIVFSEEEIGEAIAEP